MYSTPPPGNVSIDQDCKTSIGLRLDWTDLGWFIHHHRKFRFVFNPRLLDLQLLLLELFYLVLLVLYGELILSTLPDEISTYQISSPLKQTPRVA